MQTFKRILASFVFILFLFSIASYGVLHRYYNNEFYYYMDKNVRGQLSGQLDFLFIGGSHGLAAFKPEIIDEILHCNSYNLSGALMTFGARKYITEKEISRNPVHTIVIEISFNGLRSNDGEHGAGDEIFLARLDTFAERMKYLVKYVRLDDWLSIYSKAMWQGIATLKYHEGKVSYSDKGYHAKDMRDIRMDTSIVSDSYQSVEIVAQSDDSALEHLLQLVSFCQDQGIKVIFAITPLSDEIIWKASDLDVFLETLRQIGQKNNCEVYDFNLLKSRYSLFCDEKSFYDSLHMSDFGAVAFSEAFSEIIKKVNCGEDVTDLFYASYADLKQDSPYMEYYKTN